MLLLALNTATTHTAVALLKGQTVLFEKTWLSQSNEGETVLPAISKALEKTKFSFEQLDAIFVVSGPGSFSGLRIGVTIANALAFSEDIPVFSCSTFDLLRLQTPAAKRDNTLWVISAGGSRLAVFTARGKNVIIEQEELSVYLKNRRNVHYIYSDLRDSKDVELREMLNIKSSKRKIRFLTQSEKRTFAQAVKERLQKKVQKQKMVQPIYLQKPNITQSKKQVFAN